MVRKFTFTKTHRSLTEVLSDHKLASLGDAYINFAYSLALSDKNREPVGSKVKGAILAEALKKAGLRECLPSRMTKHKLADAAEALIVYAWLHNHIKLDETIATLEKSKNPVENLASLLLTIKDRLKLS